MIDLHTHTTHSDGTFSPEQLVRLAVENSLSAVAITDHDTVDAISPALEMARDKKLRLIPGVELSVDADLPKNGHLHILGLFIDHNNKNLADRLDYLRSKRIDRVYAILDKLNELDFELSTDDLHLDDTQVSIGRPHLARIMVNHGYVTSIREAFDRYLNEGKPAFVGKERLAVKDAIKLIHSAGGLAIIAHPISLAFNEFKDYAEYINDLIKIGMDGVEIYSSFHPPEFVEYLEKMAKEMGICVSGGSDFHGANKPEIALGHGIGNLDIPDRILVDLETFKNSDKETKQNEQAIRSLRDDKI
jgi:predicted metal-dependent phosphoesterase TrpH